MSRTILVIGASSDIGREFIRRLAPGTTVLAHGHHGQSVFASLASELPELEGRPMVADLSDRDETF